MNSGGVESLQGRKLPDPPLFQGQNFELTGRVPLKIERNSNPKRSVIRAMSSVRTRGSDCEMTLDRGALSGLDWSDGRIAKCPRSAATLGCAR